MNKLKSIIILSAITIGLSTTAVAQQENQTQGQAEAFQVNGECVMLPANETGPNSPFMTCQYTRSETNSGMDNQSFFNQMMERMQQMMGGDQSMQGQGMGSQ